MNLKAFKRTMFLLALTGSILFPAANANATGLSEVVNAGVAGMTSKSWYDISINSDTKYGKWVNNEWVWSVNPTVDTGDIVSSSLDYSGFDFAIIHFNKYHKGKLIDLRKEF